MNNNQNIQLQIAQIHILFVLYFQIIFYWLVFKCAVIIWVGVNWWCWCVLWASWRTTLTTWCPCSASPRSPGPVRPWVLHLLESFPIRNLSWKFVSIRYLMLKHPVVAFDGYNWQIPLKYLTFDNISIKCFEMVVLLFDIK